MTRQVLLTLTLLLAGLSRLALAAAEPDELGCIRGDCENGDGTLAEMTATGKRVYVGAFKLGKFDGYGRLTHEGERWTYKGQWRNGMKQGRGIFWDRENNVYIGQWRNDRRNGQGTQAFKVEGWREDRYTELWLRDNTENYTGSFQNDVFYGEGTYRWLDGTKYVGEWAANKKHGSGYFDYGLGRVAPRKFEFDRRVFD